MLNYRDFWIATRNNEPLATRGIPKREINTPIPVKIARHANVSTRKPISYAKLRAGELAGLAPLLRIWCCRIRGWSDIPELIGRSPNRKISLSVAVVIGRDRNIAREPPLLCVWRGASARNDIPRAVRSAPSVPNFADFETPSGVIDGSNSVFALNASPSPASSLTLIKNGQTLTAGHDYSLSGNNILFLAGAVPQPGDALVASYRY